MFGASVHRFASKLLTAWDMPMPDEYNENALQPFLLSLKIEGFPRETDPEPTQGQCDSARCSDWFGVFAATTA